MSDADDTPVQDTDAHQRTGPAPWWVWSGSAPWAPRWPGTCCAPGRRARRRPRRQALRVAEAAVCPRRAVATCATWARRCRRRARRGRRPTTQVVRGVRATAACWPPAAPAPPCCSAARCGPTPATAVAAAAPDGVAVLDAALTGGVRGAELGAVNLLVGGDAARARPGPPGARALDRVRAPPRAARGRARSARRRTTSSTGRRSARSPRRWSSVGATALDVPTLRRALHGRPDRQPDAARAGADALHLVRQGPGQRPGHGAGGRPAAAGRHDQPGRDGGVTVAGVAALLLAVRTSRCDGGHGLVTFLPSRGAAPLPPQQVNG